jgi:cell division septation protein DedD
MQRILIFDEPTFPDTLTGEPEEFEMVVGRRQAAALTFLALVVVAVFSGGSYLAGKAISAHAENSAPEIQLEPAPAPLLEAAIVPPFPAQVALAAPVAEPPLFASPVPQAIYIQVGAVEKGVATVLAEGLRKHALDSFVASGPSEKSFRVLIGPFPDAAAYQQAQGVVDRLGLASFARRYQPQ